MTRLDAGIDRVLDELDLRSVHRSPVLDYLGRLLDEFRELDEGEVATYIPELGRADPDWFGICVVTADGHVYEVGDTALEFTIQSISKPFVFGMALEDQGRDAVLKITPEGQAHFIDGPSFSGANPPDLPPRLYDANLQVAWLGKLPDNFVFDLAVQPGWHSDDHNTSNTACERRSVASRTSAVVISIRSVARGSSCGVLPARSSIVSIGSLARAHMDENRSALSRKFA